jgi:hypothetical protein
VGSRAGLNFVEKRKLLTLPGLELQPLGRPVRGQSLYQLCCPGSCYAKRRGGKSTGVLKLGVGDQLLVAVFTPRQEPPLFIREGACWTPEPVWI